MVSEFTVSVNSRTHLFIIKGWIIINLAIIVVMEKQTAVSDDLQFLEVKCELLILILYQILAITNIESPNFSSIYWVVLLRVGNIVDKCKYHLNLNILCYVNLVCFFHQKCCSMIRNSCAWAQWNDITTAFKW